MTAVWTSIDYKFDACCISPSFERLMGCRVSHREGFSILMAFNNLCTYWSNDSGGNAFITSLNYAFSWFQVISGQPTSKKDLGKPFN